MIDKKLYGLVLTGGESRRLQKDKALLNFHGREQSVHCFELLSRFCNKVFLSTTKSQAHLNGRKGYPQVHDTEPFCDIGPLGGILSAMTQYPDTDWLVLACDLPFVDETVIRYLLNHRKKEKDATAFISTYDELPEPVCSFYASGCLDQLKQYAQEGNKCLRQFLISADIELIQQPFPHALDNINLPEDYDNALKRLDAIQ